MTPLTKIAIKKYGKETCLKAFNRHINYGEGANTIGFELRPRLTTRQADAAINAGREILHSKPLNRADCPYY